MLLNIVSMDFLKLRLLSMVFVLQQDPGWCSRNPPSANEDAPEYCQHGFSENGCWIIVCLLQGYLLHVNESLWANCTTCQLRLLSMVFVLQQDQGWCSRNPPSANEDAAEYCQHGFSENGCWIIVCLLQGYLLHVNQSLWANCTTCQRRLLSMLFVLQQDQGWCSRNPPSANEDAPEYCQHGFSENGCWIIACLLQGYLLHVNQSLWANCTTWYWCSNRTKNGVVVILRGLRRCS